MSKQLARTDPLAAAPARNTLQALFESRKDQFKKVLPAHLTVDRLLRVAVTSILKTPKLMECTQLSLLQSVLQLAELGLEPGGQLGHAYLIPFRDNKKQITICTPLVGFKGYIELARRSGEMEQVEAHVVYDTDEFELVYGMSPKLHHVPNFDVDPTKRKARVAYTIARFRGGGAHVEVMGLHEINAIRNESKSYKGQSDSPWKTAWDEMAKKTVIRRAAKYWPLSAELARALHMDEEDTVDGEVTDRGDVSRPKVFAVPKDDEPDMFAESFDPLTGEVEEDGAETVDAAPGEPPVGAAAGDPEHARIIYEASQAQDLPACDALITRVKKLPAGPQQLDALAAVQARQKEIAAKK
jgi:recombination protein RecT